MGEKKDPRLVKRQLFILEQAKMIITMLEADSNQINWNLIANIGQEISVTAKTADSLDINPKSNKR